MKVLILGGSGLIGQALTRSLLTDSHQVWILTRKPNNARIPDGAQVFVAHRADFQPGGQLRIWDVVQVRAHHARAIGEGPIALAQQERVPSGSDVVGPTIKDLLHVGRMVGSDGPQGIFLPAIHRPPDALTPPFWQQKAEMDVDAFPIQLFFPGHPRFRVAGGQS